jgi:sugar phosphate isomerase/epimerase
MPTRVSRRKALESVVILGATAPFLLAESSSSTKRRMTIDLMPGNIGVRAGQREVLRLAVQFGFESIEPMAGELGKMSDAELSEFLGEMKSRRIRFGSAGLPVEFRQSEEKFSGDMKTLPQFAASLRRAGVGRASTWLMPGSNTLTYLQNFKLHKERIGKIAAVLASADIRLGLEYVGTKTLRDRFDFEFIHTMAEMRELIAEISAPNLGLVVDSWHWWNAKETPENILALRADEIVAVDLNDAPAGIPREQQIDGRRELPLATGVIDAGAFLNALNQIGYDGPVRAEPFNKALNDLDNEAACARTSEAMHKAFALVH